MTWKFINASTIALLAVLGLLGLVLSSCGTTTPTGPSATSATGASTARVTTQGESNHTPTPGAGTGTEFTTGGPDSCPSTAPVARKNENNGKFDLIIDVPVRGNVSGYRWDVEQEYANRFRFLRTLFSYTNDGRGGRYQQWEKANATPADLPGVKKRFIVTPIFIGCGLGTPSKPVEFDGTAAPEPVVDAAQPTAEDNGK